MPGSCVLGLRIPTRPILRCAAGMRATSKSPLFSGPGFVDALIALRARFEADPVLILTQEASVETVSSDYARVAARYRIAMPDNAIMRVLMDKARFQDAAERLGFPVPRAVHIAGPADLAACEGLAFPFVLKPVVKTERYQRLFKKAYKIESVVRLRELVTEIDGAAELIVQEWIEGGDDGAIFFPPAIPRCARPRCGAVHWSQVALLAAPDRRHGELHAGPGTRGRARAPDRRVFHRGRIRRDGKHGIQA